MGNHDSLKPFTYINAGFTSVHTSLELTYNDNQYILVHDPAPATIQKYNNYRWLCGHIHLIFKKYKNILNVGVDVHDFKPINMDEVERIFYLENK